jgi:hypothetical protein
MKSGTGRIGSAPDSSFTFLSGLVVAWFRGWRLTARTWVHRGPFLGYTNGDKLWLQRMALGY